MLPKCPNIKQEYEALKQKKVDFVLACKKTGNVDALSKSELNKLKKLKRILEEARDALKDRIEPYETRELKKMYEAATTAVIENGTYRGKRVQDLLNEDNFRKIIIENITDCLERSIDVWEAAVQLHNALDAGILTENDVVRIYGSVKNELIVKRVYEALTSLIQQQINGDEWKEMQDHFWTFGALLEFGTNRKELLGREAFQERVIEDVKQFVEEGQTSGDSAKVAARMLHALKRLIVLSRRHRQRDGELKK